MNATWQTIRAMNDDKKRRRRAFALEHGDKLTARGIDPLGRTNETLEAWRGIAALAKARNLYAASTFWGDVVTGLQSHYRNATSK